MSKPAKKPCPECGGLFLPIGLGVHRRRKHGVVGSCTNAGRRLRGLKRPGRPRKAAAPLSPQPIKPRGTAPDDLLANALHDFRAALQDLFDALAADTFRRINGQLRQQIGLAERLADNPAEDRGAKRVGRGAKSAAPTPRLPCATPAEEGVNALTDEQLRDRIGIARAAGDRRTVNHCLAALRRRDIAAGEISRHSQGEP